MFTGEQIASIVNVRCDQEDTHFLPSASLLKCICGKEPVYLHQAEILPKSPEAR